MWADVCVRGGGRVVNQEFVGPADSAKESDLDFSLYLFCPSQIKPQPSPSAELLHLREIVLHLLTGISAGQWTTVGAIHIHR